MIIGDRRRDACSAGRWAPAVLTLVLVVAGAMASASAGEKQDPVASAGGQGAAANDKPAETPPDNASPPPVKPAPRGDSATSVNIFTGIGNVSQQDYTPLTGKQRWQYYLNQNFISLGAFLGPVLSAGLDQVGGQPPEWGGGVQGYGKRLASRLGTGIVQGTAQSIGCAVFGQEPRYIRSSDQRVLHRISHAFIFSLITYNNEGKVRLALPTLASYYVSTMATNAWLPARYNIVGDGVRDGNRQVILAGLGNQFQEFWPEIKRYILRRK